MSAPAVERERFVIAMQAEGMPESIARRILRHANTVQRLSAAKCNGDWPCDNGERKVEPCARCEAGYVPAVMYIPADLRKTPDWKRRRICPNCHAQDLIAQWCAKAWAGDYRRGGSLQPFAPIFNGFPGGGCVKLRVPSGKSDSVSGDGLCVPTRNY